MARFQVYLDRKGIPWPRTDKGKLRTNDKTFEAMAKGYPALENLRQLRHARAKMRKIQRRSAAISKIEQSCGPTNRRRAVCNPGPSIGCSRRRPGCA